MNIPTWVISKLPLLVASSGARFLASPRSMIFSQACCRLFSMIIRLSGETSRWMMPAEWIAPSPRSAWMPNRIAVPTGNGPRSRTQSPTSWPWMCSQTM